MMPDVYEVFPGSVFQKNAERLTRKKRFASLPTQIEQLISAFRQGKFEGDRIRHEDSPIAFDVYKLRLPNPDTNMGKSNGYRVIYFVATEKRLVVILVIYYKKETADLPDAYIDGLIDGCLLNMPPEEA